MKFLIDEDSPYVLLEILKKYGYEPVHVRDVLRGATDEEIVNYAYSHQQIILTKDLGFANKVMKNKGHGLVLIRLPYYFTVEKISKIFEEFLANLDIKELPKSIIVLELGKYRIKKL